METFPEPPRRRNRLKIALFTGVLLLVFLVGIEVVLRAALGIPGGLFNFMMCSQGGLYSANQSMLMDWGPVPYTVRANSLGMRGPEILVRKPEGTVRVACVGDSVTDGFFVDNNATYPHFLGEILKGMGFPAEVFSVAKGGGSIDRQFARLREIAMPLSPDIVVQVFVTNDINDLRDKTREQLLSTTMKPGIRNKWLEFMLTKTAIGELMLDIKLRRDSEIYRTARQDARTTAGPERYAIPGGADFQNNVADFWHRFGETDGVVHREPFTSDTMELVGNYLFLLQRLNGYCREHNAGHVFAYFPSYPQIYETTTSMHIRDVLRDFCDGNRITFLDLTDAFRTKTGGRVLHLAPLDYHLNPDGNRFLAQMIADFLVERDMITTGTAGKHAASGPRGKSPP